uniref:Putative alpha/beta-glucosidase agdC n=1 Tax=Talaromyces marneffei PM1 TaxID=1077442 RepID=A0A093XJY9_TALMA
MPPISTYFAHLVDSLDKWATYTRGVIDQTSFRTLAGVAGVISSTATSTSGTSAIADLSRCPGYELKHVALTASSLTASLQLAGEPCNVYGADIKDLKLLVEYQTDGRLHVKIYDAAEDVYQIPSEVLSFPQGSDNTADPLLKFSYTELPFSFTVQRSDTNETVFDTSANPLIFEPQFVHLRTWMPTDPYIYGLGEDVDSFRRQTNNYKRTIYNVGDAFLPKNANLYSSHPIYLEMRDGQAHGVYIASSNGMDIFISKTEDGQQYLEYNLIGGVLDFYFFAGPSPFDVGRQYAEVVGAQISLSRQSGPTLTTVSQFSTRFRAKADFIVNLRRTWTLDPERFPLHKVRELVDYLHDHDQHYVVMVDPPISVDDPATYDKLMESEAYFRNNDGSVFLAGMWSGATAFVDWFHPNAQEYWSSLILSFFDEKTGVDVDAIWIDMNEPANFCPYPCEDAIAWSKAAGIPPSPPPLRDSWREMPGFPDSLQPPSAKSLSKRQSSGERIGLPGRDLLNPPYPLGTVDGIIYGGTIFTDRYQYGGYAFYDTKNLFASSMMQATRNAMLERRPNKRPLIISRSSFAGDGKRSGHWTGDNISSWDHYRISIRQNIEFAAIFQMPTIGADVCGFNFQTWPTLCSRWAVLGAWYPFYRNHADITAPFQEFYRWPEVSDAARAAIKTRYQLLDYFYTEFHYQTVDGTPSTILPLFYLYPHDPVTLDIELQFFYGSALLISPVTDDESTSVTFYLPKGIWYDFWTGEKLSIGSSFSTQGGKAVKAENGEWITLQDIAFDQIPVHIRSGTIIPLRVDGAKTTTQLRKLDFELVVAPNEDGKAEGRLWLDDGESVDTGSNTSEILVEYDTATKKLRVGGRFGYKSGVKIRKVTVLGEGGSVATGGEGQGQSPLGAGKGHGRTVDVDMGLDEGFSIYIG